MKQKIERMKSKVKPGGYRTIAVTLCFIMLLTAIGACGLFSAIINGGVSVDGSGVPADTVVKDGLAADAAAGDDLDADFALLSRKADADLAGSGDTSHGGTGIWGMWYGTSDGNGMNSNWVQLDANNSFTLTMSKSDYYMSLTCGETQNYHWNFKWDGDASYTCTNNYSSVITNTGWNNINVDDFTVKRLQVYCNVANTKVKFTVNTDTQAITISPESYSIAYTSPTNGSFTTAPTSANSGSTVSVTVKPNTGYEVTSVTYTPTGGTASAATLSSGNTYTFTMPSSNVTVAAEISQKSYTVTADIDSHCSISGLNSPYHYGDSVSFTLGLETNYALKSITIKQGSTNVPYTSDGNNYSFTMPAGDVNITPVSASTAATATIYFKSATAWVYHPFITVNDGTEQEMTLGAEPVYLDNSTNAYKPKSETGSLRYAWYKAEITGLDTTKQTKIFIRGKDTYMEATGLFSINADDTLYLACDNLMEGNLLVDVTGLTPAERDFYDTPLNMIDD